MCVDNKTKSQYSKPCDATYDPSEGPIEEDLLLGTEPESPLSGNPQNHNSTGRNKHTCGENDGSTKINYTAHRDLTKDMYLKMSQASMLPSNATKGPES